jgi:hypothetical protein
MDKETLEHFMMPFVGDVGILAELPDGRRIEFTGVRYGFDEHGYGVVILELPEQEG